MLKRDLDTRVKVTAAKDHLIETLERVLAKKKEDQGVLLTKLEKVVADKIEGSRKLIAACEKMEESARELATLRKVISDWLRKI